MPPYSKKSSPKSAKSLAAMASFKRRIAYLVIAGAALVVAAMVYLASYGPLTATMVIAVTFGVFVSVVLGGGLMAAGFFSASSGIDDEVAKASLVSPDMPAAAKPDPPVPLD